MAAAVLERIFRYHLPPRDCHGHGHDFEAVDHEDCGSSQHDRVDAGLRHGFGWRPESGHRYREEFLQMSRRTRIQRVAVAVGETSA